MVSPATPQDGYWMIQQAIASNDPVMFFEPKSRYWQKGEVDRDARTIQGRRRSNDMSQKSGGQQR